MPWHQTQLEPGLPVSIRDQNPLNVLSVALDQVGRESIAIFFVAESVGGPLDFPYRRSFDGDAFITGTRLFEEDTQS